MISSVFQDKIRPISLLQHNTSYGTKVKFLRMLHTFM